MNLELFELQAIIFDLDGVIADSEPTWDVIDGQLLKQYGVEYSGEYKHEVLGKSFPLALKRYCELFDIRADLEEMALRRRDIAQDFYANHIPMFDGAVDVLREVSSQLPVGLATSSISELVVPFLERHGIKEYFSQRTFGEEVERGKPFPDIYLKAAQKLQVDPANCLVVEDALAGIAAAKAAGMRVTAIPDARFVDVSLYPEQADWIMSGIGELPTLVESFKNNSSS
jgi:HAD superfamily hydrolase (TIGR01509 family)